MCSLVIAVTAVGSWAVLALAVSACHGRPGEALRTGPLVVS